ncbi:hypothetical protein OPT61_g8118 [Boeremia exigua]|uniref:Uncharacterized protein n=1 Tax=Boeremia exigua TaxID=749465 RepID=A0ACC2I0L6_9PLEO|nr:hypothetical protein OPT61_g8118 [Boeremia exigua]
MSTPSSTVASLPTLTQSGAAIALQAASLYATDLGVPMSIAIVDAHAHLLAFTRMDSAKLSSIETAISMATTSASNRLPTSALADHSPSTPVLHLSTPRCTLSGGLPILSPTGALLGAIGCSTGTSLQGEDAAAAGRDAVLALIKREAADEERRIEDERAEVLRLWRLQLRLCLRLRLCARRAATSSPIDGTSSSWPRGAGRPAGRLAFLQQHEPTAPQSSASRDAHRGRQLMLCFVPKVCPGACKSMVP